MKGLLGCKIYNQYYLEIPWYDTSSLANTYANILMLTFKLITDCLDITACFTTLELTALLVVKSA